MAQKFSLVNDFWQPQIAGEINDTYLKLVKLKGEFVWHQHELEDELFLVLKGSLVIKLREQELEIGEGEFVMFTQGSSARLTDSTKDAPVDAVIIGIVDSVDVFGKEIFSAKV